MKYESLKIGNYRCFLSDPQGFEGFGSVNLIIGRNNSGKSSLLDLVKYCCDQTTHNFSQPTFVEVSGVLEEADLRSSFPENMSGGDIPGNHWQHAKRFLDQQILTFRALGNGRTNVTGEMIEKHLSVGRMQQLATVIKYPFSGRKYVHIAAERSIRPEAAGEEWLLPNGSGATKIIQRYLTRASLPTSVIESTLLNELNKITEPDNSFREITTRQLDNSVWEIYLAEEGKGRVALSASGSGLQTIILILLTLHIVPAGQKKDRKDLIIGIEEPENNLHPALQRRLLGYIQRYAKEFGAMFFITTHSTVAIDQFVSQPDAKLVHVRHDGKMAKASNVVAYSDGRALLHDLDVRASDLLQSNGIIWVEGPSDRIYINKWIEILSRGEIREGAHYQCVFYGGKLLAHLSAEVGDDIRSELIDLITVNRNAAIVIDSDRRADTGRLNATKSRISKEFNSINALVWVTKGREIENYLSEQFFKTNFPKINIPSRFDDVLEGINRNIKKGTRKWDKVALATSAASKFVESDLDTLNLRQEITGLVQKIKRWNNL